MLPGMSATLLVLLVLVLVCLLGATVGALVVVVHRQRSDPGLERLQAEVRSELGRLGDAVTHLAESSAERFGRVDASLRAHAEAARALAASTSTLREALANPKARGQWGERMAEDVLRLAGFVENVNYVKQTQVDGSRGVPDYTFHLPRGHVLHMDVKFPLAAYLRHLEATTDAERQAHLAQFLRDVRQRVRELAARSYASGGRRPSVDYVLLFLPNEQLTGFIHEHDPQLIDDALGQRVVLCSPLTLFAFLGVVRQAYDSFVVEQTSDEVLRLLGGFAQQWTKFCASLDTVKRRLDSTASELEQLMGPRRRQLEQPLQRLDALRRERGIELDPVVGSDVDVAASA
jgi:DNA recombination protein RmuC